MKTESNELVYQAVDPNLAEKMRNLGYVNIHNIIICIYIFTRGRDCSSMRGAKERGMDDEDGGNGRCGVQGIVSSCPWLAAPCITIYTSYSWHVGRSNS